MESKGLKPFNWFALFNLFAQVICLKDLHVSVPEAVAVGDRVTLSCFYDLENAALYSVRWYFENEEFYRYVPKEQPPTRVFKVFDIPVDVQKSTEHRVVIRSVTRSHSGSYMCEVSADAPLFHTESSSGTMLVADLPKSEPIITIQGMTGMESKRFVNRHETFKAHCTSGPSHPAVNFTWFVNGIKLPPTHFGLRDTNDFLNAVSMTESWSELLVQVDNHILTPSNRKLIVRCETNIYSLYRGAAQVELFVLWDPREAFWHDGGKVSPTIDQRGNRGDPDNSPLTGGVANHHRESLIFKFKHNLIDTIQSLVATLFFSVLLVML
ncbi:unnamed protein product [Hermetia illucens]|uniref:Ig-like domain-containing protein n=1 Tax=Hermetia illucens TaxID=343691 RepID=A0A7R8UPR3_HERIL|nr:uncharacterized protein LOC119653130 [Hermetia illucens]CAD7084656.1 unnamed protein product [Hermetia illucens]